MDYIREEILDGKDSHKHCVAVVGVGGVPQVTLII